MNGDSPLRSVAAVTGWHTIQLNSIYMPLLGSAYAVKISYTGQANDLPLTPQIAMAADPAAQSAPTKPRLGLSLRTDYVQ